MAAAPGTTNNIIALGQFYEVSADNKRPYAVCGGLQDNGSWCGPSATFGGGIGNDDWVNVGGGDGFYTRNDPEDSNTVYSESQDGNLSRRNLGTGESKSIRPREKQGEAPYRFQWNSPVEISAFDHNTIYYGANFLFKSTNRGDTWTKVSPDLTNNEDRRKMTILGKLPTAEQLSREDGVQNWPCITVIGESPVNKDVLWVGTDDGNLQVTRDGGKNWSNVASRVPGLPKGTYVTRVIPSKYAEGTAFATFDGHRNGDFRIYIYMTTDYGQNWKSISNGISDRDGTVKAFREDPKVQSLLYAGTERGLFVSYDRGGSWTRLTMNLPTMPVNDILIHPRDNDMILATHGRSVWILDDITPIQQLTPQVLDSNLTLFDIRPAYMFRMQGGGGGGFGNGWRSFQGPNPPYGALINFYLKNKLGERERLMITISDKDGKTVRQITCTARPAGAPAGPAGPPAGGGRGGRGGAAAAAPAGAAPAQAGGEPTAAALAAQFGVAPGVVAAFLGGAACNPQEGVNRVAWNLRMDPPVPPQAGGAVGGRGGGGGGFGGGGGQGPFVEPGVYTVKLTLGDTTQTKTVQVEEDPRIQVSAADRAKRHNAIMKGYALTRELSLAQRRITALKTALDAAMASWKAPNGPRVPETVQKAADELSKAVNEVSGKFVNPPPPPGELGSAGPPLEFRPPTLTQRLGQVYGGIQSMTVAPNAEQLEELDTLAKELAALQPKIEKLVTQDLPALNKLMNDAGVPHILIPSAGPGGGGRRGQ